MIKSMVMYKFIFVLMFLLVPTLSYAQWEKVEFYGGVNLTKPTLVKTLPLQKQG